MLSVVTSIVYHTKRAEKKKVEKTVFQIFQIKTKIFETKKKDKNDEY